MLLRLQIQVENAHFIQVVYISLKEPEQCQGHAGPPVNKAIFAMLGNPVWTPPLWPRNGTSQTVCNNN